MTSADKFLRAIERCSAAGQGVLTLLPADHERVLPDDDFSWSGREWRTTPKIDGEKIILVNGLIDMRYTEIDIESNAYQHVSEDTVVFVVVKCQKHSTWNRLNWDRIWILEKHEGTWRFTTRVNQKVKEIVTRMEIESAFSAIE